MSEFLETSAEAAAQAAGYLFQVRFALFRALKRLLRDPTGSIAIERVDDVALSSSKSVPTITALLPRRVADLAPATREALFLAATTELITFSKSAEITSGVAEKALLNFEKNSASTEVGACLNRANFVGRWLATSGTSATVLTVLGVQI